MMCGEERLDDVEDLAFDSKECHCHVSGCHPKYNVMSLAAPASQIFSVKIVCDSFEHLDTCGVYGEINILDRDGSSYKVYSRKRDRAQTLTSEHNTLALSIPEECAASISWKQMSLCLKDTADDSFILDEVFSFDKVPTEDDYDKVIVREVRGIAGSAFVEYTVFSTAEIAIVQIALRRKSPLPAYADAHLYGRIVLRYRNTYGNIFPGTLLYEKLSTEPISAVSNIPVNLCSCVVAAPAYCFLGIDVNFYDSYTNKLLVTGTAEFPAEDMFTNDGDIESDDFVLRVRVMCFHPYLCLNKVDNTDPVQVDKAKCKSLSSNIGRGLVVGERNFIGCPLVELFSVMIHSDINTEVVRICGKVHVLASCEWFQLFDRSSEEPETLSANIKTISLRAPPECVDVNEGFSFELHLFDVTGKVLIDGLISEYPQGLDWPFSWYDKRLCAIVRGVHGYAAVFYTVFSFAVQASVQVSLKPIDSVDPCSKIYGSIVARYSVEDYSSEYEQRYYQSVLLKVPIENPSKLKADGIVPLLKSVVAVPSDGLLQLKVHLWAKTSGDEYFEEFLKDVEFKIFDDIPGVIKGNKYEIECSVKWSEF